MISPTMRGAEQLSQASAMGAKGKTRESAEGLRPLTTARRPVVRSQDENPNVAGTTGSEQGYAGTKSHEMTQYSVLFISADSAPAEKLERLLRDEEAHVDWLEAQVHQIRELGYERYLSQQISEAK